MKHFSILSGSEPYSTKRVVIAFALLALLFGGIHLGELLLLHGARTNWEQTRLTEEAGLRAAFNDRFSSYQRDLLDRSRTIASSPVLHRILTAAHDSSLTPFFDLLRAHAAPDISLELYDPSLRLLGWNGRSSAPPDSTAFSDHDVSRIIEEPLNSYFVVVTPVTDSGVIGYVVAKRLFDMNYPLNNRFINNQVFASTFKRVVNPVADFDLSAGDSVPPAGGRKRLVIPITGVEGAAIGTASTDAPAMESRLESIRTTAGAARRFVLLLAAALFSVILVRLTLLRAGPTWRVILVTFGIWFLRYAMIWTSFPSGYFTLGIFDPAWFTSTLAGGLAHTPGDLLLSCIALVCNIAFIGSVVADQARDDEPGQGLRWLEVVFCPIFVLLFFAFLRGFLAAVRSAVFDSVLRYNDPMYIFPPPILSVMLISLFLLAVALVGGAFLVVAFLYRTIKTIPSLGNPWLRWVTVTMLLLLGAVSFSLFAADPLSTVEDRIVFALVIVAGTIVAFGVHVIILRPVSLRLVGIILPLAGYLMTTQLDSNVHIADRASVEDLARQMVAPVDAVLTTAVNRALDDLATVHLDSTAPMLTPDRQKLAFFGWARSILSREGYNCWVGYVNPRGEVISDFHLGLIRHTAADRPSETVGTERIVRTEEKNVDGELLRIYRGYAPVFRPDGSLAGGVWVELSADRQALLGGETPEILRNTATGAERMLFRNIVYSEYFQGKLLTTTSEYFPKDRALPHVAQHLAPGWGTWVEETINGREYETFYLLRGANGSRRAEGSIFALGMEKLDLRWHLFSFVRFVFFLLAVILVVALAVIGVRSLRAERFSLGFRAKLLGAFLLVSLIPVGVLAYYNREYAIEREEEIIAKQLYEETDAVVAMLQKQGGVNAPFDISVLTDEDCRNLADDLGADFNVYTGAYVHATSKPEVFIAELFDPRLSADAYTQMVLLKTGFFAEHQTIGSFPYVVGYRPILSEAGTVIGAVGVPTLYRQTEIDEELMQRNAFLFGAYALALIIAIGTGLLFARQISSPVLRLQEAAKQIGAGNLGLYLPRTRKDEFGDLEEAFNRMARELREAQEQAFRVQRELAWKEMARQVAHEIKNPLTPMKLSIQHLRQAYDDRVDQFGTLLDQVTRTVLEQVEALSRIASEFSRFARMPERLAELCSVDDVLREALRLFEQTDKVEIIDRLGGEGGCVMADREELRRAFINVLKNAVQAIPRKGTITVRSRLEEGFAVVSFADTGKGILPEHRSRLFEPNFSTKTEGTGLGLAMVKKTVTDLGGTIAITSEVGKGTEVEMRLPVVRHEGSNG